VKTRCSWAKDALDIEYHDAEWGVPQHDDQKLFEFLILEGAQAGLSWSTILKRREGYRRAFSNFDPLKVSKFTPKRIESLVCNPEIIRNKLKITSAVNNAKQFLKIQHEFGSFDKYIWSFVNHKQIINNFEDFSHLPAFTLTSKKMSNDLRKHGFTFVGPTICYAFMQAVGMVNDHTQDCFIKNMV